jgi:SAM-dependent methyltransferase
MNVSSYYSNKVDSLQKIFGTRDVEVQSDALRVGLRVYPIRQDVIDLTGAEASSHVAEDIQYTFGAEWKAHGQIQPEHAHEFTQYFDLVQFDSLKDARVCDLGCGSGRWSTFLKDRCKELILVDFSEAIYVARDNLQSANRALFFKADILRLPFADDFADFILCLGVLHHLPVPCLEVVKSLKKYSPRLLIFLYYALDNRPLYFRLLLKGVTAVRLILARIRSPLIRKVVSFMGTLFLYLPLIALGHLLRPLGLGRFVPLYEFYQGKSMKRIQQDVYDRFFTRIEQRVSRAEIMELKEYFTDVRVSDQIPYWHFLLTR